MKTLTCALMFVAFNACAASNGGGHVVGNPMMPANVGKDSKAKYSESEKACECKDPKATPPCECKVDDKKGEGKKEEIKPDLKPVQPKKGK